MSILKDFLFIINDKFPFYYKRRAFEVVNSQQIKLATFIPKLKEYVYFKRFPFYY